MHKLLKDFPKKSRQKLKKKKQPSWVNPMLATLTHDFFDNENWIYERKLDGERCVVYKHGNDVQLKSRNKKMMNDQYPELVNAFKKQKAKQFIIDGEIVTFDGKRTSFSRLQDRMSVKKPGKELLKKVKVYCYLFDIIFFEGYDTTQLEQATRKALLKKALDYKDPLRYITHRRKEGVKYHDEACKKGWEGIIAKRGDATYKRSRTKDWLKFKCVHEQEFVIGGYTDPQGSRVGFGALLIGFYKKGKLRFAGKVGTGYDDKTLKDLHKKLSSNERKTNPFEEDIKNEGVHWVTPKYVCEVVFTEWTKDHKLRHPRYTGLRDDKDPKDVVREKPVSS